MFQKLGKRKVVGSVEGELVRKSVEDAQRKSVEGVAVKPENN